MRKRSIKRKIKDMHSIVIYAMLTITMMIVVIPATLKIYISKTLADTTIEEAVYANVVDADSTPTAVLDYVALSPDMQYELLPQVIKPTTDKLLAKVDDVDDFNELLVGTDEELAEFYEFEKVGYTNANIDCFTRPNVKHTKLDGLPINTKIKYSKYNDDWYIGMYKDYIIFIRTKDISKSKLNYTVKPAWSGDRNKSYMDYRTITSRNSPQYKLQHYYATTDVTGIRVVDGRYCVALGSYYTHDVGRYVDVVLYNGTILPCIVGDCKANRDTLYNNSVGANGGVCEFIVHTQSLPRMVKRMGDCSYIDGWNAKVKEIRILNKNVFSR